MGKTRSFLFAALILVLLAVAASAEPLWVQQVTTVSADNTTTAGFTVPREVTRLGIQIPTIASAAVTVQVSMDGTTYVPLYNDSLAAWSLTAGTGAVAVPLPESAQVWRWFKIVLGASQTAARTFTVYGK